MPELIAKCGIDCGACPWGPYPRQGMSDEEFDEYRNRVKRVLGGMPTKTPCVTCHTPDSEIPKGSWTPDRKCRNRLCVDRSDIANCAYCSRFPCGTLKAVAFWSREKVEAKMGAPISDDEYRAFVLPFEGMERLESIRAGLKPGDIVEPAKVSPTSVPITAFPEALPFARGEVAGFRAVHDLLLAVSRSPLGLSDTDTPAEVARLEGRRAHIMRFLWMLGLHGRLVEDRGLRLVVDAETYLANRDSEWSLALLSTVREVVFPILSEFGVRGELVLEAGAREKAVTTGSGYLRKKGWVMTMSFEEGTGGAAALRALQAYVKRLDDRYSRKAFRHFPQADMQVLSER